MKRFFLMMVCAFALGLQTINAQDEVITNDLIIQLLDEGFSDEEIISLIEASSTREVKFDLKSMRDLKQHKASPKLIKYIQKMAKADFGYDGVYWWNTSDGSKPQKLYRTNFSRAEKKAGIGGFAGAIGGALIGDALGNGASIVRGAAIGTLIGGADFKSESLVLHGKHAAVVLEGDQASNPVFRFYFPKTEMDAFNGQADMWYFQWMNDIQSPNEFECIKLKEKKNSRTLPSGLKFSVAGFGSSSEGKKNIVDFEIKSINNTTFEVTFPNGLEPGEYCFFYKNYENQHFAQHICCFDFSVQ
ncbi:MAG: hypothetical protein E7099_07805 [Mediterranea massiliensis]|nr:hypothetical protein [Mediterranea massiliensis]